MAFMYMLECGDGSYYTGSTKYLARRVAEHNSGRGAKYTRSRLPVRLVYWEEFAAAAQAFHREKEIQGWTRKQKQALIAGNLAGDPELAKKEKERHNADH